MKWLSLFLLLILPSLAFADQESLTDTTVTSKDDYKEVQMLRCDESASITQGGSTVTGSDTCASGDFTPSVDCRGFTTLSALFFEYGDGSGELKVWDCVSSTGFLDLVTENNSEAPVTAPTAADPKPLCVDLTSGAGVTLTGTAAGAQRMDLSGVALGFVVFELETCTGNCDSTAILKCVK